MNNNGKELDNVYKVMSVSRAVIGIMNEIRECEPDFIIAAICIIISDYCEEHDLSPKAVCDVVNAWFNVWR